MSTTSAYYALHQAACGPIVLNILSRDDLFIIKLSDIFEQEEFLVRSNSFVRVFRISGMKVISAITSTSSMSKEEVDTFLENKLNLQLGSIDDDGDPNIQPVWFNYYNDREKLLIITPKTTKKIKNL
jgi:hypothetical protein